MRIIITGLDAAGRSCVVEQRDVPVTATPPGGFGMEPVYAARTVPLPPRPPGAAELRDIGVAPDQCSWTVYQFPADHDAAMHHTDTVDFDVFLGGELVLVLDDGEHTLEVGDAVLVPGIDHGWRSGPSGAVLSCALLGTPARD